tara:strand:+ start:235 stop:2415 length:2181 start_codon:yes stop_codon:yes gene_type:complete
MKSSRFYLLILLIVFGILISRAQQGNQKSENQQEIKDLKQDIKELETELADAKINYPEEVSEIQKELDATRKMLAAFEKMAGVSSVPKTSIPKVSSPTPSNYNSPIVSITLNKLVSPPALGQDNDRLLWYKGKSINDSTLITKKGMIVQHQQKKNRVVAQPDKKSDKFQKMIEELEKTEQRKEELLDKFIKMKNGFLYYPDIEKTITLYNENTEEFKEVVKNTIELPPMKDEGKSEEVVVSKKDEKLENDNPVKESLKKILAEAKRKLDALPAVDNFPAPPEKDLTNCSWCDSTIRNREKNESSAWSENFSGPEREITAMVLSVYRQAELLGIEDFEKNSNALLDPILAAVNERMTKKITLLWERYGKQIKRLEIVMRTVLGFERQKTLLSADDGSEIVSLSRMMEEMDAAYKEYFKEQVGLKNHNFVLNFSQHIAIERQKDLLGMESPPGQRGFGEIFDLAYDYNRFGLTLNLDFIYEQRDDDGELELKATGKINTDTKIFVMLIPEECSFKVLHREEDYSKINEDQAAIPLIVESGEKTMRNEDDKLVTYSYSGPTEIKMQFPEFKINFCNSKVSDSVFFMPLNYAVDYKVPKSNLNKSYKDEILPLANHMLIDMNSMEGKTTQGMELATYIMAGLEEPDNTPPTGNIKQDKLKEQYNLKVKQDNYKKKISEVTMNKKTVFLFQANNGATVLTDKFSDIKYTIDEYRKLVKGLIHFKLEHYPVN